MDKQTELLCVIAKAKHPLLVREIIRLLNLPRDEGDEVKKLLRRMVRTGQIIRLRGRRYGIAQEMDLVSGRLKGHPDGFSFVIPDPPVAGATSGEPQSDVYIGFKKNGDAMHGDRVVARVEKHKGQGRREGRVIRILERGHTQIVGRFEPGRDMGFLVPADRRISEDLCILPEHIGNAASGDVVVAKILQYPQKGHPAEAKVVRILGRVEDSEIDTDTVIASYDLPREFSSAVLSQAARLPESVTDEMCTGRRDLRTLATVTIDGEQARDFDDAISIVPEDTGYRLWVHIADVAHYVKSESVLDQEAYQRATSVYFPDTVLPMLPENLSNGICSLKPREDRLTLTAEMVFSGEGQMLSHDLYESVICSDARMTYTMVQKIIEGDVETRSRYTSLLPQFEAMDRLAKILRHVRFARGSLDFDLPSPHIIMDASGETIDIVREERQTANRIIEEFMLIANECVARALTRRGIPSLYRIHEAPPAERIADLRDTMQSFGLKIKLSKEVSPKSLAELLDAVKDRPEEKLIHQVILRAMQQARYAAENRGHFGLASDAYTHFTSPIRRYPDLVVHRLLKRIFLSEMPDSEKEIWAKKLPEIARHCSERERVAVDAERDVIQRKQVKFMADKIGDKYDGIISGVASYGLFVQLETYFVEGLAHVSSLQGDYYVHDEKRHALVGRNFKRIYRLGQAVRVEVEDVDMEQQKINFRILAEPRRRKLVKAESKSKPKSRFKRKRKP